VPEDREALIQHYEAMRSELLAAVSGLSEFRMTEHTLDGWSVKDHLAHIALWDDLRSSEVLRIAAGHASAWRMSSEQDETLNTLAYDLRKDLSLSQVMWELETSRTRLIAALRHCDERGLEPSLYGEASLRSTHEAAHTGWIRRWRREQGL
jgi:hypothetical protein